MISRAGRSNVRQAVAVAIAGLAACTAWAQAGVGEMVERQLDQAAGDRRQAVTPDHIRFPAVIRELVAPVLARGAVTRLRITPAADHDDFAAAAAGLALARQLVPDEVELARREREAWQAAGDIGRVNDLHAQILALDKDDHVSLLGAINARIASQQTVENRLAVYARFLGPSGGPDRSVRQVPPRPRRRTPRPRRGRRRAVPQSTHPGHHARSHEQRGRRPFFIRLFGQIHRSA